MLAPELPLQDADQAAKALETVVGFARSGGLWHRGDQGQLLVQGQPEGNSRIDHIALTLPDMDAALAGLQAAGTALDPNVTPGGPQFMPEFWEDGLRFVHVSGPEGAHGLWSRQLVSDLASPLQGPEGLILAPL
ncbi:MAG: hypothetical protein C0524_06930 [Rhodobacter sp.]|nr:hypothetical protein [Rhodobacter sp.]